MKTSRLRSEPEPVRALPGWDGSGCVSWHRLTGGAGPVGHPGDEPLLFAGRLSPVALVLVGVSVRAAHWDVVFVALQIKHNQMLISFQCDRCSQREAPSVMAAIHTELMVQRVELESFMNQGQVYYTSTAALHHFHLR